MSYQTYQLWMQMSYQEFSTATRNITIKFLYLIIPLIILTAWYIYTAILMEKAKLDKKTSKKFKQICKWEFRDPIRQMKIIITDYIEQYTKDHEIDWNKFIK